MKGAAHLDVTVFRKNRIKDFPIVKSDIVFIGDSETENFELFELLGNRNVKNRGVNGDNTLGVLQRINTITTGKPQKIFIQIGINDLAQNVPVDTAISHIRLVVENIKTVSPESKIYLQSIFPIHKVKIDKVILFNKRLLQLSNHLHTSYIDLFPHFNNNGELKYDCGDGVHPNAAGYYKWRDLLFAADPELNGT